MIDRSLNYGRHVIADFALLASPFSVVLDLGAGGGEDLLAFRQVCPAASLHAVEWNRDNMTVLAKAGVAVTRLDIEKDTLPFDDARVDVVLLNQILEHTKQVYWILHEASRILRVGGYLAIGVPNLASLHNRVLLAAGKQPSVIATASAHVRGFTKPDMLDFLQSGFPEGYELVAIRGSNFYPFWRKPAMVLARLFPTFGVGIFFLLKKRIPYAGSFARFPLEQRFETNYFVGIGPDVETAGVTNTASTLMST